MNEIDSEIAALLELLNASEQLTDAREQFDEMAQLFERSFRPWHQFSAEEQAQLVARATSMMSKSAS